MPLQAYTAGRQAGRAAWQGNTKNATQAQPSHAAQQAAYQSHQTNA